jgi:hypothetical protein
MVNISEHSLIVVTNNKTKTLKGLSQKAKWVVRELVPLPSWTLSPPVEYESRAQLTAVVVYNKRLTKMVIWYNVLYDQISHLVKRR